MTGADSLNPERSRLRDSAATGLRRSLRACGLGQHARGLPAYLASHPPPTLREASGLVLRIVVEPGSGRLEAWHDPDSGPPVLVAHERAGLVTLDELRQRPVTMHQLAGRVPLELLEALDRYATDLGCTRSRAMREALDLHLRARGYWMGS